MYVGVHVNCKCNREKSETAKCRVRHREWAIKHSRRWRFTQTTNGVNQHLYIELNFCVSFLCVVLAACGYQRRYYSQSFIQNTRYNCNSDAETGKAVNYAYTHLNGSRQLVTQIKRKLVSKSCAREWKKCKKNLHTHIRAYIFFYKLIITGGCCNNYSATYIWLLEYFFKFQCYSLLRLWVKCMNEIVDIMYICMYSSAWISAYAHTHILTDMPLIDGVVSQL